MAVRKKSDDGTAVSRRRPATTPQGRENQLVALALDAVEERIQNGTASAQELVHFLKLGSSREMLEQERLAHENDMLQAKTEAMAAHKRVEELYLNALNAMRGYSGASDDDLD